MKMLYQSAHIFVCPYRFIEPVKSSFLEMAKRLNDNLFYKNGKRKTNPLGFSIDTYQTYCNITISFFLHDIIF